MIVGDRYKLKIWYEQGVNVRVIVDKIYTESEFSYQQNDGIFH